MRLIRHRALLNSCIESLFILTWVKLQLIFLPYSRWGLRHAHFQCETLKYSPDNPDQIRAIGRAITLVARYLPWHAKCLDQALCAAYMLAFRKLPSTLYFGMLKNAKKEWIAHAWVRTGDQWVVGYDAKNAYTVVGSYARIPNEF